MNEIRGDADGAGLRVGVVAARFNEVVTAPLVDGALAGLAHGGVADDDDHGCLGAGRLRDPARRASGSQPPNDAVVCLGAVIRGETAHFDLVAREAARGIADVARTTGVPCIFEVLATDDLAQARARAGGAHGNKG